MEDSTKSVIKQLMNRYIFNCSHCQQSMHSTKIRLVDTIGDVCKKCYEDNYTAFDSSPNTALEEIIGILSFPCKYSEKGCEYWNTCQDLVNHESICIYRSKLCPMSLEPAACTWTGFPSEFGIHFLNSHGDHIINFDNNLFFLEISLAERNITKLLIMPNYLFVLRIRVDSDNAKMLYTIVNVKDGSQNYEYSVKHKGHSESYIKTKSNILGVDHLYQFDEDAAVCVDLNALKQAVNVTDTVTNVFKIKTGTVPIHNFEERMLTYFECPVCRVFMKPPIFQCNAGHSICNICRQRVERCPTCRSTYGVTRNYSLEGLTTGVQYPCAYHDMGCMESLASTDVVKHEETCSFKPRRCPFVNCSLTGTLEILMTHLKQFHKDQIITESTGYSETFRLEYAHFTQYLDKKILLAFGHMFRMTCKRMSDYCMWACEVIGNRSSEVASCPNFIYEVSIIDMRRREKRLIRTDYCLNETTDDELLKKSIMFPNTILSGYSSNGMVSFHFRVKQI